MQCCLLILISISNGPKLQLGNVEYGCYSGSCELWEDEQLLLLSKKSLDSCNHSGILAILIITKANHFFSFSGFHFPYKAAYYDKSWLAKEDWSRVKGFRCRNFPITFRLFCWGCCDHHSCRGKASLVHAWRMNEIWLWVVCLFRNCFLNNDLQRYSSSLLRSTVIEHLEKLCASSLSRFR